MNSEMLVVDLCTSMANILTCLGDNDPTQNISLSESPAETCPPQWVLNRCIPRMAFGDNQTLPCNVVINYDHNGSFLGFGGNDTLDTYCNKTTGKIDINQRCIKFHQLSEVPDLVSGSEAEANTSAVSSQMEDDDTLLLTLYTVLKFITTGGHAISLVSLVIAILLFTCLRRLHCMRVTIHINLMLSFLLRAVLWYLHFPVSQSQDLQEGDIDKMTRILSEKLNVSDLDQIEGMYEGLCLPTSYSWCRVHTIFLHYVIIANNFWILIEGVYLWILLQAFSMPTRKTMIGFLLFGWLCPWIPVTIYGLSLDEKADCWNVDDCTDSKWWMIKLPMLLSLVTNFIFFVMVLKIVHSKLRFNNTASNAQGNANSYKWRLAKATLSLIPLLGISYLLTIFVQCNKYKTMWGVVVKYMENLYNSIQGFLVAVIYCFLNNEIREEFTKLRRSWQLKKELGRMRTDQRPQTSCLTAYTHDNASNVTNTTSWSERERTEENAGSIALLPVSSSNGQINNNRNGRLRTPETMNRKLVPIKEATA